MLEETNRQGINLRQRLVDFYERYYSANQMSLAIVAPQSIEQLKKYASNAFGSIPNRNVRPPEDEWAFQIPPYGSNKAGLVPAEKSIVEIVPIQELRQVTITWPIMFSSKEEREDFRLNKVCPCCIDCMFWSNSLRMMYLITLFLKLAGLFRIMASRA